jgi:FlaG/FlaF family flagellin (archaellin)
MLPEQGHVKLVLTNLFGEELRTLVDADQSEGSHTIRVNPVDDNLMPGIYLYKIKVDGETTTFIKINKMIFTR